MATIYIDDKAYTITEGQNLLSACLSLGFDLPYFCWHPAMHSVGACRQCAVKLFKDQTDTRGKIIMSCMTPAQDGMRLSIDDPEAKRFRTGVIELLMTNHPHDCPVCDEGGECHLQDMTVMTGHAHRRYRFTKRTHRNQYLGPLVHHEMNRCIACYRCVRFYRDLSGGRDLDVFQCHSSVYFGRPADGVLENPLSGNLVEICPTGVFTDATLRRHYTRKWDLQTAPSICPHCSLGCNTIAGERYGTLRRILNRYNPSVNGYFICDRGRFGYEFVNHASRIRRPFARSASGVERIDRETAVVRASDLVRGRSVAAIGSPRASLEANYALRSLVGPDHFYAGMSAADFRLVNLVIALMQSGTVAPVELGRVKHCDTVLVLGEDLANSAPMLAFEVRQATLSRRFAAAAEFKIAPWDDGAVREAAREQRNPLVVANPFPTGLDGIASQAIILTPDDIARLGFAIAHELDRSCDAVENLSNGMIDTAQQIASVLRAATSPLIVSGCSCANPGIIGASAAIARALGERCRVSYVLPACNSAGLALMEPRSIDALLAENSAQPSTLIVLETDLSRFLSASRFREALSRFGSVIVLDSIETATTRAAHLVIPAATFAESNGTFVNNESRAQRFFKVFIPDTEIQESWRWLRNVRLALDPSASRWDTFDELVAELSGSLPVLAKVKNVVPPGCPAPGERFARQAHRFSGRTALTPGPAPARPDPDPDSPFVNSMEGYSGPLAPGPLTARYWDQGWNSVQALNKYQTQIGGALKGGPSPGALLIEPSGKSSVAPGTGVPAPFEKRPGQFLLVPMPRLFGSEILSSRAEGIAGLVPKPAVLLHHEDASELGLAQDDICVIDISDDDPVHAPVIVTDTIVRGTAGVFAGVPGCESVFEPRWAAVRKEVPDA